MPARRTPRTPVNVSLLFMVFDGRGRFVPAPGGRPMLFDLAKAPQVLRDLAYEILDGGIIVLHIWHTREHR